MPTINFDPRSGNIFWGKSLRPIGLVRQDFFVRNISINHKMEKRLSCYPPEQYDAILDLVTKIKRLKNYEMFIIDPSQKTRQIDFAMLPVYFLLEQVKGATLDLTDLQKKYNQFKQRPSLADEHSLVISSYNLPLADQSREIIFAIEEEKKHLQAIVADPMSKVDSIFAALDQKKGRLGFLNVVVYRPQPDGKWVLTQRTRDWSESKYSPEKGGCFPETTVKSVIEGNQLMYEVDTADLLTFSNQNLIPDHESINNEMTSTKGPTRMLFVKLVSRFGVEAVVQIHNRVNRNENDPPKLLPDNPADAITIKKELGLYFDEVARAIQVIRERELMRKQKIILREENKGETDSISLWGALLRQAAGVTKHRFRDNVTGKKVSLEIMDLRRLHNLPDSTIAPLLESLRDITNRAWKANVRRPVVGYSDEYIWKHFINVSREFLVRNPADGEILAFSAINLLEDRGRDLRLHMYEVSMVLPAYQSMRISSFLVGRLLTDALLENRGNPIVVPARTANPQAVGGLQVLGNIFPNAFETAAAPTPEQKRIFNFVADFLNPNQPRHENTFVIDDVYSMESGLIIPPRIIPSYTKDKRVDDFCWRALEYAKFNSPKYFTGELSGIDLGSTIAGLNQISGKQLIEKRKLEAGASGEEALNSLLQRTDLYALLQPGLSGVTLSDYTRILLEHTERARQGAFVDLDLDKQDTVEYLNRLLFENLFPALPKRRAKGMILIGEASPDVQKKFEKKQRKRSLEGMLFSFIRKLT